MLVHKRLPFFIFNALLLFSCTEAVYAQHPDQIFINEDGIMRWSHDSSEVTGFGENYTVPFAYGYRTAKKLGIDPKVAIDQDVYQFSRLGLDLFRVHVWDCEISDTFGNLLNNEHLELFDYLLWKLKLNGIHAVITPIAYWGNGWPEKDEATPGFSTRYGKDNCLVNPAAILAQENYLNQFVNHINSFTGVAYKNEPDILAFEVCNEPHHKGSPAEVTSFVKKMKDAIQSTGCTKPVFYNVSHRVHLENAYYAAGINGGTFQWYPTGLGFQKELRGNMLPNVDHYVIPFDDILKKNGSARFVYEFDAADMTSSVMYPAMARSFRTAGMQLATHFAYDPTYSAPFNTEYNTHYMNLAYAPRKALSLMICAEIFRQIPLYSDYGVYPDNTSFGPFRINQENDLAEMVTTEKFYYTNNTTTAPSSPEKLKHIAGWGNSPIVSYDGTGAYFLDKMSDGLWRLEVMPDVIWIDNLFGRNNTDQRRAVIKWATRKIKITLPDLGDDFKIGAYDSTYQDFPKEVTNGEVEIKPGSYLLASINSKLIFNDIKVPQAFLIYEYNAPPTNIDTTYVIHHPVRESSTGHDIELEAIVASNQKIDSVIVTYKSVYKDAHSETVKMKLTSGYTYKASIPANKIKEGKLFYEIAAYSANTITNYTSDKQINGFKVGSAILQIVPPSNPISLFDATLDYTRLNRQWYPGSRYEPLPGTGTESFLYIKLNGLVRKDDENPNGPVIADYSMRHYFGDLIAGRKNDVSKKNKLVINAHTNGDSICPLQISLVMKDGSAFGSTIIIGSQKNRYEIPLSKLTKVKSVLLPRPYPTFLPYYSKAGKADQLDLSQIESLQISIGPGIKEEDWGKTYAVMIGSVLLEE